MKILRGLGLSSCTSIWQNISTQLAQGGVYRVWFLASISACANYRCFEVKQKPGSFKELNPGHLSSTLPLSYDNYINNHQPSHTYISHQNYIQHEVPSFKHCRWVPPLPPPPGFVDFKLLGVHTLLGYVRVWGGGFRIFSLAIKHQSHWSKD